MPAIQNYNRAELRQSIGTNIKDVIIGTAKSTVDTTSLIDTVGLQKYGDDDLNGRQVIIYDAAGSIVDGSTSVITDFDGTGKDATTVAFSANITNGDKYEIWKIFEVDEINRAINDAISKVSAGCLQVKQTESTFIERDKHIYNCLSGFKGLHTVEYSNYMSIYKDLHNCDYLWDELVDTDASVALDTTIEREGSGCMKISIGAGAATGDVLATDSIGSTDISECDKLEFWMFATSATLATHLLLVLDNTAACASPVESLAIPATAANTWTRHIISLANPLSNTAIISIGLKVGSVDGGANTIYLDHLRAVNSTSRHWNELNPRYWSIVKGSTNYLNIKPGTVSEGSLLRLTGYQLPALLSDDTTDCEIDPNYIISEVTGTLLVGHAKSPALDIDNKAALAKYWLSDAEIRAQRIKTAIAPDTRLF